MRFLKTLFGVVGFVVALLFFAENSTIFTQKIYFVFNLYISGFSWTSAEMPLYFLILAVFLLGALTALIFLGLDRIRLGRENSRNKKAVNKLQREVQALRKIPLTNELKADVQEKP